MACEHKGRVWDNGWCNVACRYCTFTQEATCKHNRKTNADIIRGMTDKELACFLAGKFTDHTTQIKMNAGEIRTATAISAEANYWYAEWMQWLRMTVEEKE